MSKLARLRQFIEERKSRLNMHTTMDSLYNIRIGEGSAYTAVLTKIEELMRDPEDQDPEDDWTPQEITDREG